ncbi:MAG: aromatic ring-hydroxylating dioxygenase subunit alpha [Betaproteobacteria bacterium]|nr:aromatic ring-hydroxylating dioxygenase subunit alpha [Betaproteobacteria bacterium]
MFDSPLVVNEPLHFQVHRSTLVDPDILALEQRRIFDRCWIYVGHESELRAAGDFRTRNICGRPVIFCRDSTGAVRVFMNTCRHRGAIVCREPEGNATTYSCFYHGWSYDRDGRLDGVPGESAYPPAFNKADFNLTEAPRVASYRGFVFLSYNRDVIGLDDYLSGAKEYIDLVIDQSPSGEMELIQGVQEYDIRANWKLLVENSFDDYHLLSTHSTWLNYLKNAGVEMKRPERGHLLPAHGIGRDLGNGHAVVDNINFRGRPIAKWIPIYGEAARPELDRIRAELVTRLGEQRAARVADTNRNLVVFPNLVLNDGSAITIRTFEPVTADRMHVRAWALGPREETRTARQVRLDSFLTFYGPGGFATPDDVEALESVQAGLAAHREVPWSVMTRGIAKEGEQLNTDELHLRAFWIQWDRMMRAGESP